ncbi:group II intron reverse transcriptase/maturase, partial [Shigella dysenteriae]
MKYQKHWSGHPIWMCVATREPPGCDGQTLKMFDQQRDGNLYKIW